jgi:AcrR family transcriptional regulator
MGGRDAPAQIRSAAERLIAERGVDVPLRDIAVAAEQRNNSAVQYHFGTRDQLITAIVEHRNVALDARRLELLAETETEAGGGQCAVRALVELIVGPMMDIPYQLGATHYARFLEQVRNHPAVTGAITASPAVRIIVTRLERALTTLPAGLRRQRLLALATVMFSLLADRERAIESGELDQVSLDAAAAGIVDMLVGLLTVDASPAARRRPGARRPREPDRRRSG